MVFNYEELEIINPDDMSHVLSTYKSHVRTMCAQSPTYCIWNSYLEMVNVLLSFISGTTDSSWDLHLASHRMVLNPLYEVVYLLFSTLLY